MDRQRLEKMKRAELINLARKNGVKGAVLLRKADLIGQIIKALKNEDSKVKKENIKKDQGRAKTSQVKDRTAKIKLAEVTGASPEAEVKRSGTSAEERVEESKYFAPAQPETKFTAGEVSFPAGYGDNRIVIMVRDPYWIYAYWEIIPAKHQEAIKTLGSKFQGAKYILRVYDVTDVDFNGANAWRHFDIEITGGANNWYLNVGQPNRSWVVEIGYRAADGNFLALARSNAVTTPRDAVSDVIDEEWMTTDFEELYQIPNLTGASPGMKKKRAKKLQVEMGWFSGSVSSWGRRPAKGRDFWLNVDTELIVYGATKPNAKVTVQGKPVQLRKDGTFSLRFALPDGRQKIPVEAISSDGADKRRITPRVERRTTK